jgi:hypothetical protein
MNEKTREISLQDNNYLYNDLSHSSIQEEPDKSEHDDYNVDENRHSCRDARTDADTIDASKLLKNSIELKSDQNANFKPLQPPRRRSSISSVALDDLDLPPRFPQRHSIRNSLMKSCLSSLIYSLNLESLENANVDADVDETSTQNSSGQYDQTPRTSNVCRIPVVIEDRSLVNDVISEEFAMDDNSERKLMFEDKSDELGRRSRVSRLSGKPPVQPRRRSTISDRKPSLVTITNDISFASFLSSITFDASHPFEVSRLDFDNDEAEQHRRNGAEQKKVIIRSKGFCRTLPESQAPPVPPRRRSSSQATLVIPEE